MILSLTVAHALLVNHFGGHFARFFLLSLTLFLTLGLNGLPVVFVASSQTVLVDFAGVVERVGIAVCLGVVGS